MEVDRILSIFGSFTRKKDKRKTTVEQSSVSAGNSPLRIPRSSRPISQASVNQGVVVPPRTSAYEENDTKEFECVICKKALEEPRLLGCLHSFCTRCLQGLHQEGECEVWSEVDGGSIRLESGESTSGSGTGSAGSGYESDLRRSGSECSWDKPKRVGILTRKISGKHIQFILCPKCGQETQLPLGGIAALPVNFVVLRKMAAARVEVTSVLCDLCNSDNKASSRCAQCLVSVCSMCGEAHSRHKATSRHSLRPLDLTPPRYCRVHPRAELSVYCATCQQVVCRDCGVSSHSGHALASAQRAAAERARLLRDACSRARSTPHVAKQAVEDMRERAEHAENEASRIEAEIQSWAEQYRMAVEAHGRALTTAAARERDRYMTRVREQQRELYDKAKQAEDAVRFAEELLSESKEEELLCLSVPVLRRLERLTSFEAISEMPEWSLRFAPTAPAGDCALVGRLLKATPQPEQCRLHVEGLQDLLVGFEHEALLELRGDRGERLWGGGEQVAGYFRRRDSSARPMTAAVRDCGDGTYCIGVKAPAPGAYLLAVTLDNKPIKGSPFPCFARIPKPHRGQFHCSQCSGGRESCRSTTPGGNKGSSKCTTGRAGQWTCCGATERNAACRTSTTPNERPNTHLYQFSL